ncbi:hypothetical protein Ancab_020498 [Ancistrocladus abbreviatus]
MAEYVNNGETREESAVGVSVTKGSLCNLYVKFDVGLPPDAVYNIVTDPDNKRVFKNIKNFCLTTSMTGQEVISRRALVDEGSKQGLIWSKQLSGGFFGGQEPSHSMF